MNAVLLALHVLTCLMVILIVLLQTGKGAGFSGLLGGGGSDALFNAPSGSMFLRKLTTGFAIAFFTTSLLLTYLAARQGTSTVMRSLPAAAMPAPAEAPAQEAAPAEVAPAAPIEKK